MKQKKSVQRIAWVLSSMAFMGLIAAANAKGMVKAGVGVLLFAAVGIMLPDLQTAAKPDNRGVDACAVLVCILAGIRFYSRWITSSKLAALAGRLQLRTSWLVAAAACLGALAALHAVRTALYAGMSLAEEIGKQQEKDVPLWDAGYRVSGRHAVFLLITAAVTITVCSKSSPLYPLNNWVDANCFFTVGKSMMHGKVLYRDIVEQKGFYLYVLHALGYLMSNTSFFGVYLLEIAAAFAFLVHAYKTALLFCPDADVLYMLPLLAAVIFGTEAFAPGDSAEEFCLPLLAYALFVGAKALRNGETPTNREFFIIGVTSGCVLWIKYTMLGFYLGWFIVPACWMLRGRALKKLASCVASIALGVCAATLPVFLYFAVNGALRDLWQVYFYDNMFVYADMGEANQGVLANVIEYSRAAIHGNRAVAGCILLGLTWFGVMKKGAVLAQMVCSLVCTAVLVFCGGGAPYYALVFAAFAPTALPAAAWLLTRVPESIRRCCRWACPVCGVLLAFLLNNNAHMLRYTEADLPQFAFREYIGQVENPTLLNYDFLDGGFYTVCDIVPHCKYFCRLNIQLEEMIQTQDEYVERGLNDFVVTCGREIENGLYDCVAQFFLEDIGMYRLYALKTLNIASGILD